MLLVLKVLLEMQQQVLKEHRVIKVLQVHKDQLVHKDLVVLKVLLEMQQQVLKEHRVIKVLQVHKELEVQEEHQVHKELLVRQGSHQVLYYYGLVLQIKYQLDGYYVMVIIALLI